jgi:hypothetical protein
MTNLCYCIFESCNGAQEVKGQATLNGGMDFGSGFTANVFPVLTPSLFQYPQAIQEPEKGESYESSIIDRYTRRVGDPGYDIE